MADKSDIEWTDATWNPITGCSLVSPGCTNCYAMGLAGTRLATHPSREGLTRETKAGPVWTGEVRLNREWLRQPLQWKRPRKIFVCAHGDLFHEDVPDAWIDEVFAIMALAPHHRFQVLTKRSARMRAYLSKPGVKRRVGEIICDLTLALRLQVVLIAPGTDECSAPPGPRVYLDRWPLANVWLGVSAEDQHRANERIPDLLGTPAAVRFVSAEPLLGPIDFTAIRRTSRSTDALTGIQWWGPIDEASDPPGPRLDWVIVGGENGPRPMHPAWVRAIRDQCSFAGVAFHFKQWGTWAPVCAMTDEQCDACYHPAPMHQPDASRRLKVEQCVLHADGKRMSVREPMAFAAGSGAMTMFAIGKKRAGRRLDGVEHNGMPT